MSQLCVDASVVMKLVFPGEPNRAQARRLVRECAQQGIELIAPAFFEAEVDSAVMRRLLQGQMSVTEAHRAYANLDRLSVDLISHAQLRQRARAIAEQFGQSAVYDSTYAALAELQGCDFWTANKPFYNAVRASLPFVKYLGDYPS